MLFIKVFDFVSVWISPKFPKLSTKQNQDELQNDEFKKDLLVRI